MALSGAGGGAAFRVLGAALRHIPPASLERSSTGSFAHPVFAAPHFQSPSPASSQLFQTGAAAGLPRDRFSVRGVPSEVVDRVSKAAAGVFSDAALGLESMEPSTRILDPTSISAEDEKKASEVTSFIADVCKELCKPSSPLGEGLIDEADMEAFGIREQLKQMSGAIRDSEELNQALSQLCALDRENPQVREALQDVATCMIGGVMAAKLGTKAFGAFSKALEKALQAPPTEGFKKAGETITKAFLDGGVFTGFFLAKGKLTKRDADMALLQSLHEEKMQLKNTKADVEETLDTIHWNKFLLGEEIEQEFKDLERELQATILASETTMERIRNNMQDPNESVARSLLQHAGPGLPAALLASKLSKFGCAAPTLASTMTLAFASLVPNMSKPEDALREGGDRVVPEELTAIRENQEAVKRATTFLKYASANLFEVIKQRLTANPSVHAALGAFSKYWEREPKTHDGEDFRGARAQGLQEIQVGGSTLSEVREKMKLCRGTVEILAREQQQKIE